MLKGTGAFLKEKNDAKMMPKLLEKNGILAKVRIEGYFKRQRICDAKENNVDIDNRVAVRSKPSGHGS